MPVPQTPGFRIGIRVLRPDQLLQPGPVHRLVLLLDPQQGSPKQPRIWVSDPVCVLPCTFCNRNRICCLFLFFFLLQVCLAVQVQRPAPVDPDRPEGGRGGVRDPHPGPLRRRRVDHQVQHPVPHRGDAQLDLLQRPNRKQQGGSIKQQSGHESD